MLSEMEYVQLMTAIKAMHEQEDENDNALVFKGDVLKLVELYREKTWHEDICDAEIEKLLSDDHLEEEEEE